jgi:oligopeptide transport system substrate-binding protein
MGGLNRIHESCGWNPTEETLTLTVNTDGDGTSESVEHTLQDWAKRINGGIRDENGTTVSAPITAPDARLTVLAALENAVLSSYQCIPFADETVCSLYSQKIQYATLSYNVMYGYGGIRLMTYNYDDAAWESFVAEQGGILNYE